MRSRQLVAVAMLAVLASTLSQLGAQVPLDPPTLVGEWVGKWTLSVGGGGREGPYSLTIKRVEGERVFATVEIQGQSRDIRATVSGNQLTFGNEQFQTVLTVEGDQMGGTRQGGGVPPRDIALTRKK